MEIEYLKNIVVTHDVTDPCQRIVLEIAVAALAGEKELSPTGLLYLTNGAAGYAIRRKE